MRCAVLRGIAHQKPERGSKLSGIAGNIDPVGCCLERHRQSFLLHIADASTQKLDQIHRHRQHRRSGPATPSHHPTPTGWSRLATGQDHTCATHTGHTLWCWGGNGQGQLGIGTKVGQDLPQQVTS